jgi:hypothetical protein
VSPSFEVRQLQGSPQTRQSWQFLFRDWRVASPYWRVVYTLASCSTAAFSRLNLTLESERYNIVVPPTQPKRQPPDRASESHAKLSVHRLEATGILVIAILLLILILTRYWRHIPWGAR